ncbi:MAG: 50S ribosomal protein L31e [Candidatus Aenigmatarchaeota archaeon]
MAGELERVYTIPLRKANRKPRSRRANAGIKIIQEFLLRHMKAEVVKLDNSINEAVWERGIHHTPSKIKVKAVKKEGVVRAGLFE